MASPVLSPKNQTCVLTIQADRPGGIPTVVDWWHTFLGEWGQQPMTLYATFDDTDISRRERIKQTFANWRVHIQPEHPNPTLAVAAPLLPLWLFFVVPQFLTGSLINRFGQHVVAGGPCFAGLPLALRRIPYIVWIGTLYEDELRGKTLIGDTWAEGVLKDRFWPVLAWQEKLVLRRASAVLAQSPYTLRRIIETVPEIAERSELAMVPIDTERFKSLPSDDQPHQRYLLNVSRINDPRKNIGMLLRAFAVVRENHPDVRLTLAGDDPQPPLLGLCAELGIGDAVDFKGKVSADELTALYQGAELFAISSTQEGLGIVMLEAMACGAPVVATACGGPEDIVIDGQTGQVVPNGNVEAMAQAISTLLDDPKTLQKMRDKCAAFIREHASPPVVEETLYRNFVQVFPESAAASKRLFDVPPTQMDRPARHWPLTVGVVWAMVVLAAFLIHQIPLHWAAVQTQIVNPLLDALR
jgi:glycosyltransferase involved in cell wall biosynthesis